MLKHDHLTRTLIEALKNQSPGEPEPADSELKQAARDWMSGRAFIDSRGTYRLRNKKEYQARKGTYVWVNDGGSVKAPWDAAVKKAFLDDLDFDSYAQKNA